MREYRPRKPMISHLGSFLDAAHSRNQWRQMSSPERRHSAIQTIAEILVIIGFLVSLFALACAAAGPVTRA